MPEVKKKKLFPKILFFGLLFHFLIGLPPLAREIRLVVKEAPILRGKNNEERRIAMFGGVLDAVEDHGFIARCAREIPPDAEVLIVSNSMANVYTLNYYLYPRKTGVDRDSLGEGYWVVHYNSPKALGTNRIERPSKDGAID